MHAMRNMMVASDTYLHMCRLSAAGIRLASARSRTNEQLAPPPSPADFSSPRERLSRSREQIVPLLSHHRGVPPPSIRQSESGSYTRAFPPDAFKGLPQTPAGRSAGRLGSLRTLEGKSDSV
jgi:hypothetical protein